MDYQVLFQNEWLFGSPVLEAMHSWDRDAGGLFVALSRFLHFLGSNLFFITILSLGYILHLPRFGITLAWGILSAGVSNAYLKHFFASPRPVEVSQSIRDLQNVLSESTFGFPSGHSHTTLVVWGLLFLLVPHRAFRVVCTLVIILVPISRMYMGVHYLGDVLGGLAFGAMNLWLVWKFMDRFPDFPHLDRLHSHPRMARTYILTAIAVTISPILLYSENLGVPDRLTIESLVTAAGALGGFSVGLILLHTRNGLQYSQWSSVLDWNDSEALIQVLFVRLVVIALTLSLVYAVPGFIYYNCYSGLDPDLAILIRYLRYFLLGIGIVLVIPVFLFSIRKGKYSLIGQHAED